MKPCPFCGKEVDLNDPDVFYPSGVGWKYNATLKTRTYHSHRDVPKEQWCWVLNCSCGAELYGDSEQEVKDKWNRRI